MRTGDDLEGGRVARVDAALGFAVVEGDPDSAERARGRSDVRYVEADATAAATAVPNDPRWAGQYGPTLTGASAVWDATYGSTAVTVCVADTGVRHTHDDLRARYAGGVDLVNGDGDPADDHWHGTHVTGIAVAGANNGLGMAGMAQASFKHVKVLDASGNGYMSTIASGIRWCADNGARVVSLSLGGASGTTALLDAVEYAWGKGAVLAAAAGNQGPCSDCVLYPARYDNVLAVGCVDQYKAACAFSNAGPQVDLVAPGNAVDSTMSASDSAYGKAAGTSMSTPHVAGAAALLWSLHPEWTNAEVRDALVAGAEDVGAAGRDDQTGHGLLRVDRASSAAPQPAPAPAPGATRGVTISPASQSKTVARGATATYAFTVTNTGSADDTFGLATSGSRSGWTVTLGATQVTLAPGASATVTLAVKAGTKAQSLVVTLAATSAADAAASASGTAETRAGR